MTKNVFDLIIYFLGICVCIIFTLIAVFGGSIDITINFHSAIDFINAVKRYFK